MKYFPVLLNQFKAFNLRERLLLVAALLGVVYFLFDFALFRPQQAEAKVLREKIAQQQTEVDALSKAVQGLSQAQQSDPLASQREELKQLRGVFTQAETFIAQTSTNVRMTEVIRSLVGSRPGLTLVSLKTVPPEPFFKGAAAAPLPALSASGAASAPAAPVAQIPVLYRHGVEFAVRGTYATLLPYLKELERNSNGIYWSGLRLEAGAYPEVVAKGTVYSLSARPELPLN